jgi:sodium-dependent dicarboxylate transporter 2/3/5
MAIGIPMVIVLVPVAWWALLRFYPPEIETIGEMNAVVAERAGMGPMRPAELKVLVLLGGMLLLWVLSTWFKQLDVALIALLGAIAMFLPGMNLFTWKEVERATGWECS